MIVCGNQAHILLSGWEEQIIQRGWHFQLEMFTGMMQWRAWCIGRRTTRKRAFWAGRIRFVRLSNVSKLLQCLARLSTNTESMERNVHAAWCVVSKFMQNTLNHHYLNSFSWKGCDKKCNGCMNVNGKEICHWAECMPFNGRTAKRSQTSDLNAVFDIADMRNYDLPMNDDSTAI